MTPVVPLLEQAMGDGEARLVLADWLEERGEEARARLVRLLAGWEARPRKGARRLKAEAAGIVEREGGLIGELAILAESVPGVLALGPALLPFVVADVAEVVRRTLPARSDWRGTLRQGEMEIPADLRLTAREGNRIRGRMGQYVLAGREGGPDCRFWLAGVAVGRVLAFVTHRVAGLAIGPGLYLLRAEGERIAGTWRVPAYGMDGTLSLRRA